MWRRICYWWARQTDPQFMWGEQEEWSAAEWYYFRKWQGE